MWAQRRGSLWNAVVSTVSLATKCHKPNRFENLIIYLLKGVLLRHRSEPHIFIDVCHVLQFCIHTEGYEVLDRFLPRALLPKDYGGDEATSEQINGKLHARLYICSVQLHKSYYLPIHGNMFTYNCRKIESN